MLSVCTYITLQVVFSICLVIGILYLNVSCPARKLGAAHLGGMIQSLSVILLAVVVAGLTLSNEGINSKKDDELSPHTGNRWTSNAIGSKRRAGPLLVEDHTPCVLLYSTLYSIPTGIIVTLCSSFLITRNHELQIVS